MELKTQEVILFVKSGYRSDEDIPRLSTRVQRSDFFEALEPLITNIRLIPNEYSPVIKIDIEGSFTERHKDMFNNAVPDDIEYIVSAKDIAIIRYDKSNREPRLPIGNAVVEMKVETEGTKQNIIIYSGTDFCEAVKGTRFHSRHKTGPIAAEFKSMLENIEAHPDFYAKHINVYIQGLYTDRLKKIGFEKMAKEAGIAITIKARDLNLTSNLPVKAQKQDLLPLNEDKKTELKKLEPVIIISTDPTFMGEVRGRSVVRYQHLDSNKSRIEVSRRISAVLSNPNVSRDCIHIYSDSPKAFEDVKGYIADRLPIGVIVRLCVWDMDTEFFEVEHVPEVDINRLEKVKDYEDTIFSNPFILNGAVDLRYREFVVPEVTNGDAALMYMHEVEKIDFVETIRDRAFRPLLKFLPTVQTFCEEDTRPMGLVIHSNKVHINADLLGTKYYKLPVSGFNADNLNSLLLASCEENTYDYIVLVDDKLSEDHISEIIECLQYVSYPGTILYTKQNDYFFKRKNIRNKMWETMELTTKETDRLSDMLRDIKFEENLNDFPLG